MRKIKIFFRKLKRLIQYIPVIWKTDDYDYGYSIEMFRYQLERTGKFIKKSGHLENSDLVALQIKRACELIDNGYQGGYVEQAEAEFERQYGKSEIVFKEFTEGGEDEYLLDIVWDSAEDAEHNKEINKFYDAHMYAAYKKADRAKKLTWQYIHKNIETWWD
jgi:hypothetical protein